MEERSDQADRLARVLDILRQCYPEVRPGLAYGTPWELLVATILSAQCTDTRVNQVTPALFERYPGPSALAAAEPGDVERVIRSIGIYRNKAHNLIAAAREVADDHGGRVPRERAALEALPGVGRKTASVVLAQAFGIAAFPVDTHVGRVCVRLGFSERPEPGAVEREITAILEPRYWIEAHLLLINHGRRVCRARRPLCENCPAAELCPSAGKV